MDNNNLYAENHQKINTLMKYKVLAFVGAILLVLASIAFFNSYLVACSVILLLVVALSYFNHLENFYQNKNQQIFHSQNHGREIYEYETDFNQPSKDPTNFSQTFINSKFGTLYLPEKEGKKITIADKVKESINSSICQIKNKDFLFNNWNYKSIDKNANKCILNFYGLPGTGKTLSARELARVLNKPLFVVDYAQMESKMVGETEKHISELFAVAKKNDAIILLDEADTLASKRVEDSTSSSRHINAARNVFMQELDKHDGVLILTTNLFSSFDPAILSRISQHIEFALPNQEMRKEIIINHIPQEVALAEDINFDELAKMTKDFSGRDIKSFTKDGILMAIMEADEKNDIQNAKLKQSHLVEQINKIKNSRDSYLKVDKTKIIGIQ
jgi:SpoVK/Ycf46/Vps4 family AAA+-type ATPase